MTRILRSVGSILLVAIPLALAAGAAVAAPAADAPVASQAAGREAPRPRPADGAVVTAAHDRKLVHVGDTFQVQIRISGADNIGHVPFHLTYDPAVLRFERGLEGEVLAADGNRTVFVAAANSKGDTVVVGLSRLGRVEGVAGEGVLCTLEFTAVSAGETPLAFRRASVRDPANKIQRSTFRDARLVVR